MKTVSLDVVYVATMNFAGSTPDESEFFKGVYSTMADACKACADAIIELKKRVTLHKMVDSEVEVCYKLCEFDKVIELWNKSTDYKFQIFKGPGL